VYMCLQIHSCALAHTYTHTHTHTHTRTHTQCDVSTHRSWDEKQRERARLSRLAMLERDNHHTDNTHMMKVQNLAEDEIVGGGCLLLFTYKYFQKCKQVHAFLRACYILYVVRTCAIHKYIAHFNCVLHPHKNYTNTQV
jgi:hypothetical protein